MIKYYCDRCGVEIHEGFNKPYTQYYDIYKSEKGIDDEHPKVRRMHLCDCCTDLMDDFFNKKAIKGVE